MLEGQFNFKARFGGPVGSTVRDVVTDSKLSLWLEIQMFLSEKKKMFTIKLSHFYNKLQVKALDSSSALKASLQTFPNFGYKKMILKPETSSFSKLQKSFKFPNSPLQSPPSESLSPSCPARNSSAAARAALDVTDGALS
jgi:hypothetical protein